MILTPCILLTTLATYTCAHDKHGLIAKARPLMHCIHLVVLYHVVTELVWLLPITTLS